jgi:hypothetical protein
MTFKHVWFKTRLIDLCACNTREEYTFEHKFDMSYFFVLLPHGAVYRFDLRSENSNGE